MSFFSLGGKSKQPAVLGGIAKCTFEIVEWADVYMCYTNTMCVQYGERITISKRNIVTVHKHGGKQVQMGKLGLLTNIEWIKSMITG